ncbi:MAG: ATP-dependent RNA helicase HrpA [Micropruina sp.]|nr:MAG: ATP-dependent RNA helicase HrpA [Micropruina sp.]
MPDVTAELHLDVDPALPISAAVDEIAAAIATHQVVVVAGETGSGKTTQLPKICLLAGRRRIGHTQPRRIAARSVAERMAEELRSPLGEVVGYQVRFTAKTSRQTRVKLMTDGILLAEISHDRDLRRYDTLIIDEAHERSLNIDFLLGYLKQLLPRRPDLKVIVTSATIDTARFSAHFGDAPVIEVSGRTYPVEVRYRPLVGEGRPDRDLVDGICDAVTELVDTGPDGDILVFCSGEQDIRDAAEAIEGLQLRFTEVLPLYARLTAAEQHRVFTPHTGRRIVLATNVAETSLTVPGIRSVVDPGFARISRYSARTKVQRLPIEPVSQASANQRAGRCGRVAPGVCIRLYSEEDYAGRPEFTEPEILRTNLASVILQMADARLGDISRFPFVEAPDGALIGDGMRLLRELGAITEGSAARRGGHVRLTPVGHKLARLPVDPRLGRMLVEAERQGSLREVEAIVAGLAIQDVRERPADAQDKADAAHRRFWAPVGEAGRPSPDGSDIAALLRLWDYLRRQRRGLSGNAFRRLCREEYLHFLRVREWQDLHTQLRQLGKDLGMNRNSEPASLDKVHAAVLSGLLSHVGLLDEKTATPSGRGRPRGPREYLGARGTRFAINPGSSAFRLSPPLVMAVELVETTRLWARTVAPIRPEWIEEVGAHLLKRTYSEPRWSARGGQVVATERVTLLGVPIVAERTVGYARIDPVAAREIFIRAALVEGQWHTRHRFFARNEATRQAAEELQERTRRRDLVVDDQTIFDFYAARVPTDVVSVAHFDRWWRDARHADERLLDLTFDDLLADAAAEVDTGDFPDTWTVGELDLPVSYTFDPGAGHDGVSVEVDLGLLNRVGPRPFTWQVPGFRAEVATELIRSLPKQLRARLVPAPDTAARAVAWLAAHPQPDATFPEALGRAIHQLTGIEVPPDAWRADAIPEHLRVRFVVTEDGREVATGKDLAELGRQLGARVERVISDSALTHARPAATRWDFGSIPVQVDEAVVGYPALADEGTAVSVQVFPDAARAATSHARGLRRLVALTTPDPTTWVVSRLSNPVKLALATSPYPGVPALLADCRLRAIADLIAEAGAASSVRDDPGFAALRDRVRLSAADRTLAVVNVAGEVLGVRAEVLRHLAGLTSAAADDITEQLGNLVFDGFVAATPQPHFGRLPRYLKAARQRVATLTTSPARDKTNADLIEALEEEYAAVCRRFPDGPLPGAVAEVGWLLEELRVSLFAQTLGTAAPVSAKRVRAAMEQIRHGTVAP